MPRALRTVARAGAVLALATAHTGEARADPDPCSSTATVSPCFDADPLWVTAGSSPFVSLAPVRALDAGALSLVAAAGVSDRPVVLVAPSPHPDGREVDVVDVTSTLTLGARYGLGRGVDATISLPIVPYQSGTGAAGVTSQAASAITTTTLRDPRLGLWTTLIGRAPAAPLALSSHLEVALPLGEARALAGAAGPTVAPGATLELEQSRFTAALDAGFRLRRAVAFGTVTEGSEFSLGAGVAGRVLERPLLAIGVEAGLRAGLVDAPPGAPAGTRNLPAEWLGSLRFALRADSAWSAELGMGSGLPLSRTAGNDAATLGVTAPRLRGVLVFRYAFPRGVGAL